MKRVREHVCSRIRKNSARKPKSIHLHPVPLQGASRVDSLWNSLFLRRSASGLSVLTQVAVKAAGSVSGMALATGRIEYALPR